MEIPKQLQKEGFKFCLLHNKAKIPFEKDWNVKGYSFDDEKLLEWIEYGNNYGIICGYSNLMVIDFDEMNIYDKYANSLPKTFTVATGSDKIHKYFFTDNLKSFKAINNEGKTLIDFQGERKQVVAPNSIHPNGNKYRVIEDIEIAFIKYNDIKNIFSEILKNQNNSKINLNVIKEGVLEGNRDETTFRLACRYKGKKLESWETYLILQKWNEQNKPPLSEENIKKCVESAYRYSDNTEQNNNITLKEVYNTYKSLMHIEDTARIDVLLAVALSTKLKGIPLWLIIVGASGDMKSVQLNALKSENVFVLHNLTSKTLVNGFADKRKYPDLAPQLNNKILVIPDLAQILKLNPNEKGEVWGQLRDLYDGLAGKASGLGTNTKYSGLKVTLLAGSTPAIDDQILVHQDLGTRELIYRTFGNREKKKVMQKCFDNEIMESEIEEQLSNITTKFIEQREIKREKIPKEIEEEIMNIAFFTTLMRATASFDSYTHDLRNDVYPEEPTRIAKQLKRLYVCLKALDELYEDKKARFILWHIARSSAFPLRIRIFDFLLKNKGNEYSSSELGKYLKIGHQTVKRECACMHNMGLLDCRKQETTYPDKFYDFWKFEEKNLPKLVKYTILSYSFNSILYSLFNQFTDKREKEEELVKDTTQDIVVSQEHILPIVCPENYILEDKDLLLGCVQERGKEGYPLTEFAAKYGTETTQRLLKNGDVFNINGVLRIA